MKFRLEQLSLLSFSLFALCSTTHENHFVLYYNFHICSMSFTESRTDPCSKHCSKHQLEYARLNSQSITIESIDVHSEYTSTHFHTTNNDRKSDAELQYQYQRQYFNTKYQYTAANCSECNATITGESNEWQ